ncbi:hypothetical protein BKE38_23015 [Pseudoroseomonas deserti]|uniref:RNA polymerase subunit sigma-70 n=1 Tax=Teichococcus deserti TaxID=1817963 RepID=A0A1V2GX05_9PROT|nr:sigma-70 family RNA polymerase sigma factor [Pseudoroseomonas deserti]ONG47569.1 hypothetical protein BKE38_23015 [Pseudoroseomonas deserti]
MAQDPKLELYLAHRAALLDYATALLGDRARAEDAVQDAYLRFVPERAGGPALARPIAYLYRILRNLAWDQGRLRRADRRPEADPAPWMQPETPRTPEQELLHAESVARVGAVLEALPEKARIALEMQRFGGYTLEEIAARLQVSVPTAHRLVRDALMRIAADLPPEDHS